MRTRFRIVLIVLLVAIVGGLAWQVLRPHEPLYQGKPLSYWVATHGVVVGSNMVPFLVQALERRDGPLQKAYANAWIKFAWFRKISPTPPEDTFIARLNAAQLLIRLGMNSTAAINALSRAATNDESSIVRMIAASSLARINGNEGVTTKVQDLTNHR